MAKLCLRYRSCCYPPIHRSLWHWQVSLRFVNSRISVPDASFTRLVLFQVTASQVYRGFELIPFVFLGIVGGVFGHYFIRLNIAYAKFRASDLSRGPILEVSVVALLTALVSYLVVYARLAKFLRNHFRILSAVLQNTYNGASRDAIF